MNLFTVDGTGYDNATDGKTANTGTASASYAP